MATFGDSRLAVLQTGKCDSEQRGKERTTPGLYDLVFHHINGVRSRNIPRELATPMLIHALTRRASNNGTLDAAPINNASNGCRNAEKNANNVRARM